MIKSSYQWQLRPEPDATTVKQVAAENQLDERLAKLLVSRGLTKTTEIKQFLEPSLEQLNDPLALGEMSKAIERIQQAIMANEKITVYGDYDADGVTSTSLMLETLESLGANVTIYIPDRFKEGYGPHVAAFEALADAGTKLIITVDNGISGVASIAAAKAKGVDVIVTDHHELPPKLPDAYAIVHPRLPGSHYPFPDLAGVGVAFKVATALLEEVPIESLDLAAIGTVCDIVSLTGENRALVALGLQQLQQSPRPGISALCEVAKLKQTTLDEQSIGFGIGPRLNALGRLGDAKDGVKLLTTFDPDEATQLAKFVQAQNERRQNYVKVIYDEAIKLATTPENTLKQTLVLAHENWHEGVLGIVASRIVEKTGKPTLVLNIESEQTVKGSGRSVAGFDLFAALNTNREQMTTFGGHQMAAGLTLPKSALTTVSAGLEAAAVKQDLAHQGAADLIIDLKLTVDEVTPDLLAGFKKLAPFGTDNKTPLLELTPEKLTDVRAIGADKTHLKLKLCGANNQLDAIAFRMGGYVDDLVAADQVTVVGELGENEWQGNVTLQLMVKDLASSGVEIIDKRTSHLTKQLFSYQGTYVFFNAKYCQRLKPYIEPTNQIVLANEATTVTDDTLILVDAPVNLADLTALLKRAHCARIIALFYTQRPVYLDGMPTHQQFGRLFKFVLSHKNVAVRAELKTIAHHLQLKEAMLIFMIQVFFELGFVKIDDGVMNGVAHPDKHALTEAPSYQQREQKMKSESVLIYSNYPDLKGWFNQQQDLV
ncbi:single-stranded-DNA-specific exonuclease RecJ [Loigolactobacillus backii]|uniref:Single-stranded-DNA-specific exonuclease RecJ n=1 Tax=Loigolactobacillus backii TaxID=375175 RepID=A0A192H499_9LACO|nr:single-stranded-DNA-specific exonuclease RecJ [Loigolactobacillus backii]ANK59678.1 single-stranded-DNA-specific exonuclease RecJ [Loigolactobacillus backii]ANK63078.1 single-stranded-DNA-specific exonuclease RecJ [Loigolactobacillus backii]ANK64673.1 single-stranded-DNA-specific exonuclease RecJ [Loigolactobacillus backii]ANK66877.1 single-stranded-DNA-specific exonuclease RecJ [Loigolactobacillus backii]ANK69914.1 single-stranded-DNA-specific exonuclease RecJ [Loigolactobacillus backii]